MHMIYNIIYKCSLRRWLYKTWNSRKFLIKALWQTMTLERHGRAFSVTQRAFINVTVYVSCILSILFLALEQPQSGFALGTEAPRAVMFEHSLNTKTTTWNRDDFHDCRSAIRKRRFFHVRLIGNYFSRRVDTISALLHASVSPFRFYRNERYVVRSDLAYVSILIRSFCAICFFVGSDGFFTKPLRSIIDQCGYSRYALSELVTKMQASNVSLKRNICVIYFEIVTSNI